MQTSFHNMAFDTNQEQERAIDTAIKVLALSSMRIGKELKRIEATLHHLEQAKIRIGRKKQRP